MTHQHIDLDLEGRPFGDVETVLVPRLLAKEMSEAIAAMQALASEAMIGVAKGLGLVARRQRKPPAPLCSHCHVDVAIGLPHDDRCPCEEAARYRQVEIPKLAD